MITDTPEPDGLARPDLAPGSPEAAAAPDPVAVLQVCHARALEREGIPMFVALVDGRPGHDQPVRDEVAIAEGRRLASLLDGYYSALESAGFPNFTGDDDPDETGAAELIDALVVLAEVHLRARTEEP